MARVIVVGSFNVDHVWRSTTLPPPGATLGGEYASGPGGKGFNQAMAAARAGAATRFVCALGADAGAQLARALCASDGIDLRDAVVAAPTGTAGIFVDGDGRNCIVVAPGANGALASGFACDAAQATSGDVVLVQLESPPDVIAAVMQQARDARATVLLNPAPANVPVDGGMLALADVLTPNETEFAALVARHVGPRLAADAVATLGSEHLHALCRDLHPHGTVVVTLGAGGCFVSHPPASQRGDAVAAYRVPAETVRPIDTTGAGDAFNGALAAALGGGGGPTFQSCLQFAGRYAALSTEQAGAALAMPSLAAVQARFPND